MSASANRPDDRTIGDATDWLAQVSAAASGLAATHELPNEPRLAGRSISLDPARDRFFPEVDSAGPSPLQLRPGLVLVGFTGLLLSVALTAAVVITHLRQTSHPSFARGIERGSWSGPLPPAILAMRDDLSIPHLIVQSSRMMAGEPASLGVAVEGRAEDAVVIIAGLMPGMKLSTGSAFGGDAWQLPATDLHYAWIAPPGGFVGSAAIVVELRSSDDRLIDRQVIQLEWTIAVSTTPAERELNREETAQVQSERQEVNEVRATSLAVSESSLDQEHMVEVPATYPVVTQRSFYREEPTAIEPAQQVAPKELTKDDFGIVRRFAKDRHGGSHPRPHVSAITHMLLKVFGIGPGDWPHTHGLPRARNKHQAIALRAGLRPRSITSTARDARVSGLEDQRRTHSPVAAVPAVAHFAPSVAPLAHTRPARTSPSAHLGLPRVVRDRPSRRRRLEGPAVPTGP
jgi:hypothetical protein